MFFPSKAIKSTLLAGGFAFSKAIEKNANACIRAVKAVGGETILAHPYWCGHRYDQFAYLKGFIGVEVYNAICDRIGRSSSEEDWSHLIDAGRVLPALAVDDSHDRASDACRGWTWLKLPRLTVPAVMGALRTGCFFSSTGPKINHFGIRRGVVEVHCSPAVAIYLVGFGWCGARLEAPAGKPIRRMVQKIGRDWRYVRAVVVDASGKKAWTNPISL